MQAQLTKTVKEDDFWTNYFYHVHMIKFSLCPSIQTLATGPICFVFTHSLNSDLCPANLQTKPQLDQLVSRPDDQSVSRLIGQSINRSIDQSVNWSIGQSISRSVDVCAHEDSSSNLLLVFCDPIHFVVVFSYLTPIGIRNQACSARSGGQS